MSQNASYPTSIATAESHSKQSRAYSAMMPNSSINRTACKLRVQVRSGLRPPPAGYLEH